MEITITTQEVLDFLNNILEKQLENPEDQLNDKIMYEKIKTDHPFDQIKFEKILDDLDNLNDINIGEWKTIANYGRICYLTITNQGRFNSREKHYENLLLKDEEEEKEKKKTEERRRTLERTTIHRNRIYIWVFYSSIVVNIILSLYLLFH